MIKTILAVIGALSFLIVVLAALYWFIGNWIVHGGPKY